MVEYRKHVGIDRCCVDKAYNSNSNSNAYNIHLLKQILPVQFVVQYIGSKIIPHT